MTDPHSSGLSALLASACFSMICCAENPVYSGGIVVEHP